MKLLLQHGAYPAIATHDEAMIRRPRLRRGPGSLRKIPSSSRCSTGFAAICSGSSLRRATASRLYVPFGQAWYPYYMRRLAERPANVFFVLRNLLGS